MEYALITGATSGIGFELSVLYAQNGYGLVLVSSSKEHLENTENRLNEQYSVPILIYEQDLTKQGAALELYNKIKQKKLDVTVLINNAGFGLVGATDEINVSSTGAFQPGPYTSTYFASKAFVLSYSRAIRYEAKARGVQICILCPGATKTGFFRREGTATPNKAMLPEQVARIAFRGLMKNKEIIIPGLKNRLLQLFPLKIKMLSVARMKKKSRD